MPLSVRFSARALADLKAIAGWITREADRDVGVAYTERVREACLRIADFPNGGTPRPGLQPGLRSFAFERRTRIFYRALGSEIVIARIFHGSRDLKRAFPRKRVK